MHCRAFFHEIKSGRRSFKPRTTLCREKGRNTLSAKGDILQRWKEHLDELLNSDLPSEVSGPTIRNLQPVDPPPSFTEVNNAIKKLKNNKSPGPDSISSEFLKAVGPNCVQLITELI
ncbi:putative endonuclease-reverse transcriptase [Trichonephila clavipes]|nr:putative endonuclease-reverse transcriptase [Trichonephila clavipes]